jgi:hypothetical protein
VIDAVPQFSRDHHEYCTCSGCLYVDVQHYRRKKKPKWKVRWWMKELYRQRMQYGNRLMRDMTFSFRHLCPSMCPRVYFCYGN